MYKSGIVQSINAYFIELMHHCKHFLSDGLRVRNIDSPRLAIAGDTV